MVRLTFIAWAWFRIWWFPPAEVKAPPTQGCETRTPASQPW